MRLRLLPAVVATLMVWMSTSSGQDEPDGEINIPDKIKELAGDRTLDIIDGATKVEVFRLQERRGKVRPKAQPAPKGPVVTIGSDREKYTVEAAGKEQGNAFAAKLKALLIDKAASIHLSSPGSFDADVAFRLWKDKESVTIVVAFNYGAFKVVTHDAEGKQVSKGLGYRGFFDSTEEHFARMKAVAVEAFPDDEKLKALKKSKEARFLVRPPVGDKVPENLLTLLEKAEQFELFSLQPIDGSELPKPKDAPKPKPDEVFHGYKILGKTTVKEQETRKKLVAGLKKGVEDNNGLAAGCFNPRHGIRLTQDGKTTDFVICFECLFISVYSGDKAEKGLRTTGEPAGLFNSILKDAKVPLAKSPE